MNLSSSIVQSTLRLGIFAALTAIILGATYVYTQPFIEEQIALAERKSFDEVLPPNLYDNDLMASTVARPDWLARVTNDDGPVHVATNNGKLQALVFRTDSLQGYSGRISLIVAIDPNLTVLGTRVISHKETPGLGDKIEVRKSDWILGFNNQSFDTSNLERWDVTKYQGDFDQFTGATITPRAVVSQLRSTLNAISTHPEWIEELGNE